MALEAAVYTCFERSVADKIVQLVLEHYKPTLQPFALVDFFNGIESDVRSGTDTITGRKFEPCEVKISMDAVLRFAERLRGRDFARQVESHLQEE